MSDESIHVSYAKGFESLVEALKTLGRYAANPDLSFSWYDAAVLGQKVRLNAPRVNRLRSVPPADRAA
jgi:hypothetical protein